MRNFINLGIFKTAKFYVAISGLALLFVASILYTFTTTASEVVSVKTMWVFILSIISIVIYVVLALIKPTEYYSTLIGWALIVVTFIVYVYAVYAYFPAVFFNGISWEAIKGMDKGVLSSLIIMVISLIVGNVAIYLPCSEVNRKRKQEVVKEAK